MPKEITLDMLAETSKPVQKPVNENKTVEVTETIIPEEQNVQKKPFDNVQKPNTKDNSNIGPKMGTVGKIDHNKMKPMDASQMAQQLINDGVMQPKKDETEELPVVQNAFTALEETIKEREKNIDNLLEVMQENADEDKLNRELDIEDESDLESELERQQNYSSDDKKSKTKDNDDDLLDFDDDEDEDDIKPESKPKSKKKEPEPIEEDDDNEDDIRDLSSDIDDLNDLIDEIDDSSDNDSSSEDPDREIINKYKKAFKSVKIIRDPIDLSKFTISDTPKSNTMILRSIKSSDNLRRADWTLYHTRRSMTFIECSGPELESLRKIMENGNDVNRVIASLQFIYDHVYDKNKPDFESWTKLVRTEDIDSMYYGIYKACYSDTNLIAKTCPSCKKTSLINIPIEDMVVYGRPDDDHEKIKKEFNQILNQDTTTSINPFKSELMQISDNYVVAYSPASLYSTFIMYSTLDPKITKKHAETLNTMSYIDRFFYINRDNNELDPVKIKEFPDDLNESVKRKLKVYKEILDTLNNDQYNMFMGKLNSLIEMPKISYITPKCVCPECGEEIPETAVEGSMLNTLFIRAQLARIMSL